jgi:beta-glucuronidase
MIETDRRTLLALGAMSAAGLPAPAAANPASQPLLIASPGSRRRTGLGGLWHYVIDPFDIARRKPRQRRSLWRDELEVPGGPLIEYEWDTSPTMRLPGDWNSRVTELAFYDGPIFFRRRFDAEATGSERLFLHFEAVNYRATVWLNGEEVGGHEGGFTPFWIEVTGKLKPAGNSLVVRADSRHGPESLPSVDFDWQNYGGITRPVWLTRLPATFIRDWFCRLEGGQLRLDVVLDGPEADGQPVRLSVAGLTLAGRTGADGRARLAAPAPTGLRLWSPGDPHLHPLTLTAGADRIEERIGFRTLETRGRALLLNGRPIRLHGISIHEEAFGATASRAVSRAEARALLQAAKNLDCNFVRLAHYPHGEAMAELADEMGLLVWAEIPVYWEDIDYESVATLALARRMMAELVLRDRNRASVALWSVANETPRTAPRTQFLETVIADVRRLDSTRLLTAALDKNVDIGGAKDGETRIRVDDPLAASLDVLGVNQYEAWYSSRTPAEIADVSFETPYEKPLVFSEFGADALYGHRGERTARWTEDYQAWLFEETLKLVERTPGCIGCAPWLLKDFRSPRRWHGRFQANWNRKGVLNEEGREKLAAAVLRTVYSGWT